MTPELSAVYHLSPDEVLDLTQSQLAAYLRHLDRMRKAARG